MNRAGVINAAIAAVVAMGSPDDVAVRSVQAMCASICGKKLQTREVLDGIRAWRFPVTVQQQAGNAPVTPSVLESTESSNDAVASQQPRTGEPADLNGVVVASASSDTGNPYPLTTFGDVPPEPVPDSEPLAAVADTPAPALFAVPDVGPTPKVKPQRITIASQDADADFGEFESDVDDLLAVEAAARRDGKISESIVATHRRTLAFWLRKHGSAAFAHGVRIGIETGKGVRYAGGVMRNFDPERDRAPLRSVEDAGVRISVGGIIDAPNDPRPAIELREAARAAGRAIAPLIIPPCQLLPGTDGALPPIRCPHCREKRVVA